MKKYLCVLLCVFVLSFVFAIGNFKADAAVVFNTPLKALNGSTKQGELNKSDLDYQVIYFGYVQSNRAIKFKMNTSNWSDFSALPQGNAFEIHSGRLTEAIAIYTGDKVLYLKTKSSQLGTTALSGTWFMAKSDFLRAYPNYANNTIVES